MGHNEAPGMQPEDDFTDDNPARLISAALSEKIGAEIDEAGGAIPFSRFQMLALYAPGLGYYSAGLPKFGPTGDFVTAPESGALFAQCVAEAVAPTLKAAGPQATFFELGGGSGKFAVDAMHELQRLGAAPARYLMLEPSATLAAAQKEHIAKRCSAAMADRFSWIERPPEEPFSGVLFANEVLDALPTTRFAIVEGEIFEEHVGRSTDEPTGAPVEFATLDRPADAMLCQAVRQIEKLRGERFPDGYRSEVLPQLPYWLEAVAGSLEVGLALFCDYGYNRSEFYLAERRCGTLIAQRRHRVVADPLEWPGLTDLSAFVDFSALAAAGAAAGFELAGYASQAAFLLGNGLGDRLAATEKPGAARHPLSDEARRLMLPSAMGERFRVMGLSRGIDARALFAYGDQSARL